MTIIGVSAKKQGGKSTVVRILQDMLPNSTVIRFADYLKEIVLTCFIPYDWKWTVDDLDLDENKNRKTPCGLTVRKLLQTIGTDWFRHTYPDCWISAFQKKFNEARLKYSHVLVPDVRFPNELYALRGVNGVVIRLLRAPYGDQDQHESETALDAIAEHTITTQNGFRPLQYNPHILQFDAVCDNRNMTLDELKQWVVDWVYDCFNMPSLPS